MLYFTQRTAIEFATPAQLFLGRRFKSEVQQCGIDGMAE